MQNFSGAGRIVFYHSWLHDTIDVIKGTGDQMIISIFQKTQYTHPDFDSCLLPYGDKSCSKINIRNFSFGIKKACIDCNLLKISEKDSATEENVELSLKDGLWNQIIA